MLSSVKILNLCVDAEVLCAQRNHWNGISALAFIYFHFYGLLYHLFIRK